MTDLPYSLEPTPGYNAYKVTSLLRDYLATLVDDPENQETIEQILKLIDGYVIQLKQLRLKDPSATTSQVYGAIDNFFLNTPDESKQAIQCRSGCTACCYIDVDVSQDEAVLIVDYCRKNGIDPDIAYLTEQAAAGRAIYSSVSRCVFLKDNMCSIYPVRPIACRKHWVTTNPDLCDFSGNVVNQVGGVFNINTEILASAMLNVQEVMSFEKALLLEWEKHEGQQ